MGARGEGGTGGAARGAGGGARGGQAGPLRPDGGWRVPRRRERERVARAAGPCVGVPAVPEGRTVLPLGGRRPIGPAGAVGGAAEGVAGAVGMAAVQAQGAGGVHRLQRGDRRGVRRRDRKRALPATKAAPPPPPAVPHKGNISRSGKIYHVPGSGSYEKTRIDESKGERWFCTEEEAKAAGWRAPRLDSGRYQPACSECLATTESDRAQPDCLSSAGVQT